MVFIQSNDRKGRYEFRAIQESCKMRSMYKNEIRAKQENNDTCKSVIHTQQLLRVFVYISAYVKAADNRYSGVPIIGVCR